MDKEPIAIEPSSLTEAMDPQSRLRLDKVFTIECNVKVREVGMVVREQIPRLLDYCRKDHDSKFELDHAYGLQRTK